jgi:cell division protease FtsH
MVTEFGMSDLLGPYAVAPGQQSLFLDSAESAGKVYSEATAQHIDRAAQAIVTRMYQRARQLLQEHRQTLETLAQYLLKHEVIDQQTFVALTSETHRRKESVLVAS